jgi:hypothetical protein
MKKVFALSALVLAFAGIGITVWGSNKAEFPRVILVGNPAEVPSRLVAKLPAGYEWTTKEIFEEQEKLYPIADKFQELASEKIKNTRAVFMLFEGTDMDDIMGWARKNGKKEIYIIYTPPPDPDTVMHLSISGVKNKISSIVSVKEAWADTVPDSNCTTGTYLPAGGCVLDEPARNTGEFWRIKYCFMYGSYSCHWSKFALHLTTNLRSRTYSGEGYPASFPHCMNAHNPGQDFISTFPQPLNVNIYPDPGAIASECGRPVYGCAYPERDSKGNTIYHIAITKEDRNGYGAARHELAHLYGYCHAEMDADIDRVAHCINGNTAGPCVASGCTTACSNGENCQYSSTKLGKCLRFPGGTFKCCIPGTYSGSDHIYR